MTTVPRARVVSIASGLPRKARGRHLPALVSLRLCLGGLAGTVGWLLALIGLPYVLRSGPAADSFGVLTAAVVLIGWQIVDGLAMRELLRYGRVERRATGTWIYNPWDPDTQMRKTALPGTLRISDEAVVQLSTSLFLLAPGACVILAVVGAFA